jgi:hypothetical protein
MSPTPESPTPWYPHFWPWFIVVLMGVSVAASLWTVAIAYRHRDVEVGASARPTAPADQRASTPDRTAPPGVVSAEDS